MVEFAAGFLGFCGLLATILPPGDSIRDLLIPKEVTFTTIEMVTFSHHPKKVTIAELPGRDKNTKFNIFLGKFHCDPPVAHGKWC